MALYKNTKARGYGRIVAEKVLGKKLQTKNQVHHIDFCNEHNENNNLVVCENREYHMLLHRRTLALNICGHADWEPCKFCSQYSSKDDLKWSSNGSGRNYYMRGYFYHSECRAEYRKELRLSKLEDIL